MIGALSERGHPAVDTDSDTWSRWASSPDGSLDWIWREDEINGKSDAERALVVHHVATVEPLLRRTATHVVDATVPVPTIVAQLEAIAATSGSRRRRTAHGS